MNGSGFYIGLAVVAGIAHLVGFIWLLVCAFKVEKRWGWMLLGPYLLAAALPVVGMGALGGLASLAGLGACIVFVVRNWKESKRPFFVLLGSWIMMMAGIAGLVVSFASAAREQFQAAAPKSGQEEVRNQDPAPLPMPTRERPPRVRETPVRTRVAAVARPASPMARSTDSVSSESKSSDGHDLDSREAGQETLSKATLERMDPNCAPLAIECQAHAYDARDVLQTITLVLSNSSPRTVHSVKMQLSYLDYTGRRVKDWTTMRELDQCLKAGQSVRLMQPAYFMPSTTRKTTVEVKAVRFEDGSEWPPPSSP